MISLPNILLVCIFTLKSNYCAAKHNSIDTLSVNESFNGQNCVIDNSILAGSYKLASKHMLIELFSSQGCRSCLKTDSLIDQLIQQKAIESKDIAFISYHVTYWNSLGWFDKYSTIQHDSLHQFYAFRHKQYSYTPAIVVNGLSYGSGNNLPRIETIIDSIHSALLYNTVFLYARFISKDTVLVELSKTFEKARLHYVVVKKRINTAILNGENKGKLMMQYNTSINNKAYDITSDKQLSYKLYIPQLEDDVQLYIFLKNNDGHVISEIIEIITQ